ncbi:MAG: glycosyltransferase family 4 protein, partial [Acidimicrobiia bacterium]
MRILMVSPYPPTRDGLANYAVQEVKRLRADGDDVEVLSPGPSAAHHHLDLIGARGALALARRVRSYDRVIVQYHPNIFFGDRPTPSERARTYAALTVAFRTAHHVEVRVHEYPHAGAETKAEATAARQMWAAVDRISVHTERERVEFAAAFGIAPERISIEDHGANFEKRTSLDKVDARARLGLPADGYLFLAIGFVQPHKGFDRAVRAFAGLAAHGCRLEIVGSVRLDDTDYVSYVEDLRALVAATPGANLREEYVSDAEFDIWIVAADALVLPYRLIWSSGVCERAALYHRPVIASRIGGLADQGGAEMMLVDDDRELAIAMRSLAGLVDDVRVTGNWPGPDRAAVMDEIRLRASRRSPAGASMGATQTVAPVRQTAPLRRLRPLTMPDARSARPGASALKRVVRRLTAWQTDPIIKQVNQLQQ